MFDGTILSYLTVFIIVILFPGSKEIKVNRFINRAK